jgi:hypothetical protein
MGRSCRIKGTACLCILEPIKARLASSCSKKGINEAAIEIICNGDTPMYCTDEREIFVKVSAIRAGIIALGKNPIGDTYKSAAANFIFSSFFYCF